MRAIVHRSIEIYKTHLTREQLRALRGQFTYRNPEYDKKKRLGVWYHSTPKEIQHYEETDETILLPRGATGKLKSIVDGVKWFDRRLTVDSYEFELSARAKPVTLREDQEEIVQAVLSKENCLIRAAPGAGKTECLLEAIRRAQQPAIVIVWSSGLLEQWISRIQSRWGWSRNQIGVVGQGKRTIRPITIAMQQTLYRGVNDLLPHFGFLAADEVQRSSARTHREVISQFPARYRVGVSADERRKDRLDVLTTDLFGDVAKEVSREELIQRGDLCEVDIIAIPTDVRIEELEEAEDPSERGEILASNWVSIHETVSQDNDRNELIARLAAEEVRKGESVLVFVQRVDHARELSRLISIVEGTPCGLCLGGVDNRSVFEETISRLDEGDLKVAVATSCMYQGQDIPRLSVGIVAAPLGSNAQLFEQVVGRVRRKFPGKNRGRIYYLWDSEIYRNHVEALRRTYGRKLVRIWDDG